MPFHLHKNGKKTQAGIPYDHLFFAAFGNFRIDERPGLGSGQLQKDHALQRAYLRSGDGTAVAGGASPKGESVGEIFDKCANLRRGGIIHALRNFPKARIAQLQDSSDGHCSANPSDRMSLSYRDRALTCAAHEPPTCEVGLSRKGD
jgi:hypothetical protein